MISVNFFFCLKQDTFKSPAKDVSFLPTKCAILPKKHGNAVFNMQSRSAVNLKDKDILAQYKVMMSILDDAFKFEK